MVKTIVFNEGTARIIRSGLKYFKVFIESNTIKKLPVALADEINKAEFMAVREVVSSPEGWFVWGRIEVEASTSALFEQVCEAIQSVYNCDIVVCNERGK